MASGPWAPRDIERRANAFSAMFLMPAPIIRSLFSNLPTIKPTVGDILKMARTLKFSVIGVIDHLHNIGLIDKDSRERLREGAVMETQT
jgi:Zn-dependent peptidase ImmA (M78 family)